MDSKFLKLYNLIMEDILKQSTGLSNRKPGDQYFDVNNPNDQSKNIIFEKLYVFQNENDTDQMSFNQIKQNVKIQNQKQNYIFPIAIAVFTTTDGNKIGFIKQKYNKFSSSPFSSLQFKSKFGYSFNTKMNRCGNLAGSQLSKLLDLNGFLSENQLYSKLINGINKLQNLNQNFKLVLKQLLNMFHQKNEIDFNQIPTISLIEKQALATNFGEILDFFALINHHQLIKNANIIDDLNITQKSKVLYNSSQNQKLKDFQIKNQNGSLINVSSKDKVGAASSVTSLFQKLKQNNITIESLSNEQLYAYQILEIINQYSAYLGPIKLLQKLLNENVQINNVSNDDLIKILPLLKQIYKNKDINKINQIANKNKDIKNIFIQLSFQPNKLNFNGENNFYNILAGIAKLVCNILLNSETFQNGFNQLTKKITGNNFIQMNMAINTSSDKDNKSSFKINDILFEIKRLTNNDKIYHAVFMYDKTYFSTGNKGKLTFKIK